jgi:hypothetical protein
MQKGAPEIRCTLFILFRRIPARMQADHPDKKLHSVQVAHGELGRLLNQR